MRQPLVARAVHLLVLSLAVLPPAALEAQGGGAVRGKVSDAATGRPVAAAQVYIQAGRGTLTNAAGEYMLVGVPAGEHRITAQIIGFGTRSETVRVETDVTSTVNFALTQTTITLDEIVVTGVAGASTRRSLGNTVARVDAAKLTEVAPVTSVDQMLTGRTPGLTMMAGSGTTGTSQSIRIRGAGSLNAGNRPIFFVDGVRYQDEVGGEYSVLGQSRNALDHLNPDDIESIEVIKGPAASTLYGAEAASGVIQIITKKGRVGRQSLQWTAKVDRADIDWTLPHPNNYKICTAAMIADATNWPGCQGMDAAAPEAERMLVDSPLERNGTCAAWILRNDPDCTSIPALRSGMREEYNLSVRGGGERFSFFASGESNYERGVFYNNHQSRKGGRVNVQVTPLDNLETSISFSYNRTGTKLPLNDNASNGLLRNAYRGEPGRSAAWEPGYLNLGPGQSNFTDNVTSDERTVTAITLNHKATDWFTSRLTMGLDKLNRLAHDFYAIDTTGRAPFGAVAATGQISRNSAENHLWTVDYAGTASFDLKPEISNALSLGMQYSARKYHAISGTGEGLVANTLNLIGSAAVTRSGESQIQQNSVGFYVQDMVGFRNRLFVTGALRMDDNSAFGEEFTMAVYPKLSASWIISEESFFPQGILNNLKLRAAWGKAGNSPSPFSADRTLSATSVTLADGTTGTAIQTSAYGNPNLKAESGQEYELGFESSFLNDRASLEATYYEQRTKDALVAISVPPSSGYTGSALQNIGEIGNRGLELALFGTPIQQRNVSLDLRMSAHFNKNWMIRLGRDPIIFGDFRSVQRHVDGYPLAGYWAVDVQRDESGKPILDANGAATRGTDTTYVGPSAPTREFGFTTILTLFGNVRLYAFADYKGGHYLWSAREWWRSFNQNISYYVNHGAVEDRAAYRSGAEQLFIDNADFIKLREVSVAYTLPAKWSGRFGASSATLQFSGRNLGLWTKYDLGSDPELNFNGDDTFGRTDYMSVPQFRQLVASFIVNF